MTAKVTLTITKGEKKGQTFEYTDITRVLIGRMGDCAIIMPEKTVSRYHCLLEIAPPQVRLQDFGSLNGTYLNGEKIGQRDRDVTWEEARKQEHQAFDLHDGDILGLGSGCELQCRVEKKETCALCGAEISDDFDPDKTVSQESIGVSPRLDAQGRRICESCWQKIQQQKAEEERKRQEIEQKRKEAERKRQEAKRKKQEAEQKKKEEEERKRLEEEARRAEEEAKRAEEEARRARDRIPDGQKKCGVCGGLFTPTAPDNNLCAACLADRARLLDGVLAMLLKDSPKKPEDRPAPPAGQKPAAPSILSGYDKVSLLGKGGMGEVWKVRDRKTGKEYALKTMLPAAAADEQSKRLFLREASICECLRHPNVVKAYKTGCANGTFYILMDLCEGGSVDDLMKQKGGRLSVELATYIMLQVLSGLDYVHNMDVDVEVKAGRFRGTKEVSAKGVVHRDFKPGNIFLTDRSDRPVAMVADFGLAKAFSTAGMSQVSTSGVVMGTPVFMPRQQAANCKYAKPDVDVWAAAASYYYMLTGKVPKDFRPGKNPFVVIISESAIPIRQRRADIPAKLAAVIDHALEERPAIGCSTARELRQAIVSALPESVKSYCRKVL